MSKMKVVQCWDDGLTSDIRLIEILQRHGAKASFNLNMGLYKEKRHTLWNFEGTDVIAPARNELLSIFEGFDIANHSLSHPYLTSLSAEEVRSEITDNKSAIEDLFQKQVKGFIYPFGDVNEKISALVKESNHLYARTVKTCKHGINCNDPFQLKTTCHFLDTDFWDKYKRSKQDGVFYFWGHSFELINESMWMSFEKAMSFINDDSDTEWCSVADILEKT